MNLLNKIELVKELYNFSNVEIASILGIEGRVPKKVSFIDYLEENDFKINSQVRRRIQEYYENISNINASSGAGSFRFIDLFAGIGGMRTAFESVGGECVFSSEIDPYPAEIYADNFKERPSGDITKIPNRFIPPHDVLVAGFPCQPFSLAGVSKRESMGMKHGFECETKGTLFFDVARILKHHKPKMFLLENVKNLKSHDKGNTYRVIRETLENLGYTVSEQVINASLMLPQNRERIYIVGTLDSSEKFEFPKIKQRDVCVSKILESKVDPKYTLTEGTWLSLQRHSLKHKEKGNGFGYGLIEGTGVTRTLSARYYKDGAEILIKQKRKRPRRLTPRECARLMGFSDRFKLGAVSDLRTYKCFGNSVAVPIIKQIARKMTKSDIMKQCTESRSIIQQ